MTNSLVKRLLNTLLLLISLLAAMHVVWAVAHHYLEPQHGWVESFDWASYTMTTNGEGYYPPTKDSTRLLSIAARWSSVLLTLLVGANFVKNAIDDPNAFTHSEQLEARRCDDDTNAKVNEILTFLNSHQNNNTNLR